MKSEIQINNTAGVCQIDIEGTIGVPEEWQFEEPDARVATYERFRDTLRRIAEIEAPEVVVNIRTTRSGSFRRGSRPAVTVIRPRLRRSSPRRRRRGAVSCRPMPSI